MREVYRVVLRHGSEAPLTFERDHETAGWTVAGEWVIAFPGNRGVGVEQVIHDIVNSVTYAKLQGVLYDDARRFTDDIKWLRDEGWQEVEA